MSARGFTLIEVLIASTLFLAVSGMVAALIHPARDAAQRTYAHEEMTTGARSAMDMLARAAHEAGASSLLAYGARLAELTDVISPLVSLDDPTVTASGQALSVLKVPRAGPQAVVRDLAAAGATSLQIDSAQCTAIGPACGFEPGLAACVFDEGGASFITITATNLLGVLVFSPPLPRSYGPGTRVAAIERVTFGVRREPDGGATLLRQSSGGAQQPLVRHVADFTVQRLAPASVALRIRIEAADHLRGPAGPLFRRAGTAVTATRWVPDLELSTIVALRNVAP